MKKITSILLALLIAATVFTSLPFTVSAAETEDSGVSSGSAATVSFLLTDNLGWGTAYIYAVDANDNELCGQWPGTIIDETSTNDYGERMFVCYVPAGAVEVIINNGGSQRTEPITDFGRYTGYWMNGATDDYGHYIVTGWGEIEDPTQETTEPTTEASDQPTFFLSDSLDWGTAYMYAWDAGNTLICSAYPLQRIVDKFGVNQFVVTVPDGAARIIINNGSGALTEDIRDFTSYTAYLMDGSRDSLGHYKVSGYIWGTPEEDQGQKTVRLVDSLGWESALVFAWDADNNPLNGEWPGNVYAETTTNDNGETVFIATVPEGAVGVVVNNGNGSQTEDITDFSYCEYRMDGSQSWSYHYIVTGIDHSIEIDDAVPATCTETGLTQGSHCSKCGKIFMAQEEIPATGHTVVTDPARPETCTEAGLTEGSHCSVCGEILQAQETIPAAHDMVEDIRFDATCTEDGVVYTHCSRCGELGEEVIPALGHDFSEWTTNVEASCEADGEEESECTRCGLVEKRVIPKLGHDYIAVVTPPTCTEGGYTTYTCSHCQDTYTDDEVDPLGHDYVAVVTPATCTEGGYTTHTCSHCQDTYTDNEVEALGHEYIINVRRNATLTSQGLMAVRCDRCGTQQNVILPKLSETDYTITNNTATCTEAGTATYTWKDTTYGTYSVEAATPSKGHTPEVLARVEPTCTETGLTEGSHCSVCGEVFVAQEVIPATGHTVVTDDGYAPTCTETGLTEGSHCSVCGEVFVAQEVIPATGHIEVIDAGYEPTCTETGLTEGVHCAVCGEVITAQEVIPANGHHGVVVPGVPATTTTTGLTDGEKCDICGEWIVEQQVIPVIAQGVVDGVYYENGVAKNVGLVRIGNDFYYTTTGGRIVYGDQTIYGSRTNGLLPGGVTYHFDEVTGKLYKDNVIIDDIYYKEGAPKNVGIVKVAGAYYVTTTKGVITKDAYNKYIASSRTNGLVAIGYYDFGPDGKMILRNGIIGGKYYVNGKATNVGLFEYEADGVTNIYCTTTGGVILKDVTNKFIASSRTNGLAKAGYYSFDGEGRMIK